MAWIRGFKPGLRFLLLLLFYPFSATPGDAHSLCYNFTVDSQPRPGQPWCVVQGQVDGKVFLSYDCGRAKIQFTSPLGEEVKTTKAWETQTETLRDIGDLLREQLPDVTSEKRTVTDPLTLQGRMTCRCEDDGHISGSWQFGFSGQMCLLFDSENGHWTEVHSGGRRMREKWEKDRAVTNFFKKVSMGDCRVWLQDFLVHWEEMLKTTASPAEAPLRVNSSAPAIRHITWILPVLLTSFIIIVFLG
ncbi:UL16-binding protein 3 [Bos mutus]|uniref:UL16-binding protein 3 n=1 Tax=Bos mutus TaxID=72004 RepID=UPI0003C0104B|nr:PREDICTED: NKG2D ligand 3 [Bos mutus]XP_061284273.1 UL16-binding protein 3-like [Bos javanicus]XP_061284274.1 UL16-binding protein 3-like [Bos javanicus]